MYKRSDTERAELPSSTNLIASNFSSNVLLRIWTVSVVSNFVGSLHEPVPYDPLKNLTRAAHNTKKYAIFVHVKSSYYSHKPNFIGLNNRSQIYKIVTKEHVYMTRICGGLDIFL